MKLSSPEVKRKGVGLAMPNQVLTMLQADFVYKVNVCMLSTEIPSPTFLLNVYAKEVKNRVNADSFPLFFFIQ